MGGGGGDGRGGDGRGGGGGDVGGAAGSGGGEQPITRVVSSACGAVHFSLFACHSQKMTRSSLRSDLIKCRSQLWR